MRKALISSLIYRYLFVAAPFGVSGSAKRHLCSLLILFYFSAFSAMPLTHIHVEDKGYSVVNIFDEHKENAEGFLVFLHEILHLHFKDRADHALFPNSRLAGDGLGSGSLQNNQLSMFIPRPILCQDDNFSFPDSGVPYLFVNGQAPKAFKGFHSFNSSLSPPSA